VLTSGDVCYSQSAFSEQSVSGSCSSMQPVLVISIQISPIATVSLPSFSVTFVLPVECPNWQHWCTCEPQPQCVRLPRLRSHLLLPPCLILCVMAGYCNSPNPISITGSHRNQNHNQCLRNPSALSHLLAACLRVFLCL
jgi:hypothetical protein